MGVVEYRNVGLCFSCSHARRVPTAHALYWLCGLSATDPAFERYPRLPIIECDGYSRAEPEGGDELLAP